TAAAQQRASDSTATSWTFDSENARYVVEVVDSGLKAPVSFSFLPDGRMLAADRPTGRLLIVNTATGAMTDVQNVPHVHGHVDGGLLEVLVHPDYAKNHWIYLAWASEDSAGNGLVVARCRLRNDSLVEWQPIFIAEPRLKNSNEFGARLVLDHGYLYISAGQRNTPAMAQDLGSDLGKVIRLFDDGRVPRNNPFVGKKGVRPEIYAYGMRNPVGLAIDPWTGALWEHEHGPKGGDEVNIIAAGKNYGWPTIGYGVEYDGKLVGEGITHAPGMEQPLYYWIPDIAPTGMFFYTDSLFPGWHGNVFIGSLHGHLVRLVVDGARVLHEERLIDDRTWRIRAVAQGPDGAIYIGVDGGMIMRLRPVAGGIAHPR
ncbi:MAG TPA: PQQ-dependent sugar dehydrogenase, partial [Dongiaceae bacterium]|nr:PQQ-dependent sugar dehydrogenase [Dongiaceae bacterium]